MKVYATVKTEEGSVVLLEWPSVGVFQATESWIDPKFINIAKTSDLGRYEFYRSQNNSLIIFTPDQVESHNLLHRKFHNLRAKGAIR